MPSAGTTSGNSRAGAQASRPVASGSVERSARSGGHSGNLRAAGSLQSDDRQSPEGYVAERGRAENAAATERVTENLSLFLAVRAGRPRGRGAYPRPLARTVPHRPGVVSGASTGIGLNHSNVAKSKPPVAKEADEELRPLTPKEALRWCAQGSQAMGGSPR